MGVGWVVLELLWAPVPGHQTLGCVTDFKGSARSGRRIPWHLGLPWGRMFSQLKPAKRIVLMSVEGIGLHPKTKGIRHRRAGLVSWTQGCPSRDTGTSRVRFTPKVLPSGSALELRVRAVVGQEGEDSSPEMWFVSLEFCSFLLFRNSSVSCQIGLHSGPSPEAAGRGAPAFSY